MTLYRWTLSLMAAALLSSCATTSRLDAAGDVHALLVAVRNHDRAGFDAHIDRSALKVQLRARLVAEAAKARGTDSLAVLGAILARPLVDLAVDQLVQPDVFAAVAETMGYWATKPVPDRLAIASLLVFRKDAESWRLVGFEGDTGMLRMGRQR